MTEKNETQKKKDLPVLRGELALMVVVLINSLGVVLMLYSGSGISAISSVPYAFSEVFTKVIFSVLLLDLHSAKCLMYMRCGLMCCRLQSDTG